MLHKLHLKSFKCFEDKTILFAPLTLLTGLNCSGKSSVLQALRIAKEGKLLDGLGDARDLRCSSSSDFPEITVYFASNISITCTIAEFDVIKTDDIPKYSDKLYYISADRFGPKVSLPFKNNVSHVGDNGENVYAFLSQYRNQGGVPDLLRHESIPDTSSIIEQIRAWLTIISPGISFDFQIYENADISTGSFADYRPTNVGFGLSYALPLIVSIIVNASLISNSENDTTLLIENPEAHLHPRGQTQLGYFIALAAQCGIQCIVETHSEHILNGIRIAVKEGKILSQNVIFNYFVKDLTTDSSEIIPIFTDKHGMLDSWPDGFFDETERALLRLI